MTKSELPAHLFQPGYDPRRERAGRKAGSRAKLATAFINDAYALWEEQGEAILRRMAFHEPAKFAEMIAKLMPQKIEIETPTTGMSFERLSEMVELAERMIELKRQSVALQEVEGAPAGSIDLQRMDGERGAGGLFALPSAGEGTGTSSTPPRPIPVSALPAAADPYRPASPLPDALPVSPTDVDPVDPNSLF